MGKNKDFEHLERVEASREDCFLCSPNEALLYHQDDYGFAMTGLGSMQPGYSVIATYEHIKDVFELPPSRLSGFLKLVEDTRRSLEEYYGSCLLAEHGKIPLCSANSSEHCFHPHFLLFPNAIDITPAATAYFDSTAYFNTLYDALRFGCESHSYYLISPSAEEYWVFPYDFDLPRQFLRLLVAESLGSPEKANWKSHPNLAEAVDNANDLKRHYNKRKPLA